MNFLSKIKWPLAVITLFLSSIGVYDHLMTLTKNRSYFDSMGYSTTQIDYFTNYPLLLALFWTIGVWAMLIGSVLLPFKPKLSFYFYTSASIGQAVLSIYTFAFKDRWHVLGNRLGTQDLLVLTLTILLSFYSLWLFRHSAKPKI